MDESRKTALAWMENSLVGLFPVGNNAGQFSVGANLSIDFGFTAHELNARACAQRGYFQYERIARYYWPAETCLFYSGEQHELLIAVLDLAQSEDRSTLRHRFDHQDTGHDWRAGKMTLKIRFVDADLLNANDALARDQLDYSIDQKKGITVREKFLDCFRIQNSFHTSFTCQTLTTKQSETDLTKVVVSLLL